MLLCELVSRIIENVVNLAEVKICDVYERIVWVQRELPGIGIRVC